MFGTVGLEDLEVDCIVGLYDQERVDPQKVFVTIKVGYLIQTVANHDNLESLENNGVDYFELANFIRSTLKESQFKTLETLVVQISKLIYLNFEHALNIDFLIKKPEAITFAQHSFCHLKTRKEDFISG